MAPILGIMASQISGHLWAPSGAYDSIATTTVGAGGAASITFSSIPSTYTHLQLRVSLVSSTSTSNQAVQFNSDTGANYARHALYGNGSTVTAAGTTGNTSIRVSTFTGADATYPTSFIVDILDYANTNKYKTVRSLAGIDLNGSGEVTFLSGLWLSTSAISTLVLTGGGTIAQNTVAALYGIKGN